MKIINFVIFFSISIVGFAQHYPTIEYSVRDGLAQTQVIRVLEDSRGYIWAVTKGGLSKYDGEKFENFYRKDSLKYLNINEVSEDSKKNIWVKYDYRGYAKFDGKSFINFTFPQANSSNIIEHKGRMLFIRNDSLFSLTNNKITFDGSTCKTNAAGVNLCTENNRLYLATNGKLYLLDEKNKKFNQLFDFLNSDITFSKIRENILLRVNNANQSEFYLLKNNQLTKLISVLPSKTQFFVYPDFNFSFGYDGKTWIYDRNEKNIVKVSDEMCGTTESNKSKESQRLYIGTERGLLCVFLNGFKNFTRSEVPYAWGVVEDENQHIWISNFSSSLQKFEGKNLLTITQHEPIITKALIKNGYPFDKSSINSWYYNPLKDKYGKLWFPRLSGALIIDKNKFEYFNPKSDTAFFFNIAEDRKRSKILSCGQGGLAIIENKLPYKFKIITDTSRMFQWPRYILTAAVDSVGNYWLGGRHIVRYNPDKNTFDYYTDWNKKLAKMGIANLTFDSRGGLWAGTFNEGLAKYNPKTDKFEAIFEQYLKDKPTYFLGQISEKHFAIGDDLNIYIIDLDELYKSKQEKVVKILNYHNGFMGIEPSQNGFYKASDGKIWVCSGTVLSYFDPKQINFTEVPLRTYIRKINDQRLPFDYENLATIELEKDINEVRINVESVGEDKSANAQFSYRIKGFQEEWSPWQTDRTIYLTNMPQGEFTIEVRSQRSNIANENHPITKLSFKVNIPFWKSPEFYKYAFLLFLILGSILSLIWYKNINQGKRLSQQKRLSEEQERKIKLLQIQTTQAQLNPHFIFNVLQTLQGQIRTNQRSLASENIVKLAHLIRSFLNASIIDNKQTNSILALEITLEKEIDLIKTYIEFEQEQKDNFDFEIIESSTLNVANFSIQPLLIQPFVENAIKHGFHDAKHRGKLIITFSEEDEILMCVIDDNGIGRKRSEEIQSKSLKKYKSLGTELVKKRIEILNQVGYDVQINTIDKLEGGTRVIISIDYIGK